MKRVVLWAVALVVGVSMRPAEAEEGESLRGEVVRAMRRGAEYYRGEVATHGGYVYHYSEDLSVRWGEGLATRDQIWVQPPGTPTVGMAYLKAYEATGERFYLEAATATAEALVYGQLESGGWTNCVDFNPRGERTAQYRNGGGRGKNHSSLDDGQSQSAIRLLVRVDKALGFEHKGIHEAAEIALDALLKAQFPNGGFPQVWTGPVEPRPVVKANYPDYDWRTEGRIKNYWDMYTLNDNVCGYVAEALIDAYNVYGEEKYKRALQRLGDFLLLAQMPEPQRGWAQQYNDAMQPIWARRFEPPGVSGDESQEALETLLRIARFTGEGKYLEPVPGALAYLKRSLLPEGRLARYYELKTNRPLYMARRGGEYTLTYDDSRLPGHYGWKSESRLDEIEAAYRRLKRDLESPPADSPSVRELEQKARKIVAALDRQGRWVSVYGGERLVGQPKFRQGARYLSSAVFSENLEVLSGYLLATGR